MEAQRLTGQPDSTRPISVAVIEAVAEDAGVGATGLPPLREQVDPEVLDTLFRTTPGGSPRTGVVEFQYYDRIVTISYGDGIEITVEEEKH